MQSRRDRRIVGTEYSNGVLRRRRANGLIDNHTYLTLLSAWIMTSFTSTLEGLINHSPALNDGHIAYYPKGHLVGNPFLFHATLT